MVYALVAAFSVLALAYMASRAFSMPSLGAIVQDELIQVLATGAIAFMLVGLQALADQHLAGILEGSGGQPGQSVMAAANDRLNQIAYNANSAADGLIFAGGAIGEQASKSVFCSFMGLGFSLANCAQFNAFRGSITAATFAASTALADTFAQQYLLSLASNYAFTFIIPLGVFLRCFKFSRGAGGALIAVGFGFYAVYPAVILATDGLLHGGNPPSSPGWPPEPDKCDPKETDVQSAYNDFSSYADGLVSYDYMYKMSYLVLVRTLFLSVLNLIITLAFIRAFAHMLGSEIDVSTLARIS
jgi:hypothetical protein